MDTLFRLKHIRYADICYPPLLEISSGARTFISGPSGSGKSTLLKLLSGMVSADEGSIYYQDKNVEEHDPVLLRREILLAHQSAYLFDGSIKENFETFYHYREESCPPDEVLRSYLDICSLDFDLDADTESFSGGERHRLYLAICLSFQPKVLLLDEPTGALDDKTAFELMDKLSIHCRSAGIDLVVVSHNEAVTAKCANSIIRLEATDCAADSSGSDSDAASRETTAADSKAGDDGE